jgi:serine/threonine protein kinase
MPHRLQINDTIGEYRITGFLGEGGMGVVYRGVHEKLGRPTAIKVLASACNDPSFKSRFMNEARLQAGLHHPNVATLYDYREYGDELAIFMELVDGDSLDELVDRRAFTVDEALTVFASICEAIAYLHENGVLHRDIKSQNAKLTSAGTVKLLDFGIAKDASSLGLTQTGGVIGTPNYLSPGQFQGKPATPQTDIWALGILLYEMLTGQLPFRGSTLGELVAKIVQGDYIAVDNLNPAVPPRVANIVRKCLKKDPSARYSSTRLLLTDIRTFLDSKSPVESHDLRTAVIRAREKPLSHYDIAIETSPSAVLPTGLTPRTRMRLLWASAIGGGMLLLIGLVIGMYLLIGSGDASAQARDLKPVKVFLDEGAATVLENGRELGKTPYLINLKPGEKRHFTLHREGFIDKEIDVTDGKQSWTFQLTPKE